MKFQKASKREIKRVALGGGICFVLMTAVMLVLSLFGVGRFDYTVILGGLVGTLVAVANFALLCLTIQGAMEISDKKKMKARFQLSYNARLIAQALWVLAAFLAPCFHVVASALPLLFPTLVIFYLNKRGDLVTPSERKNPEQAEELEEVSDKDPGSFEV